jgi:hypothetical protein
MVDTKQLIDAFRQLPLALKRAKIDAILKRLENNHPFFHDLSEFFLAYDTRISEPILDYVYDVTMRCVDAIQYGVLLEEERANISHLKAGLAS